MSRNPELKQKRDDRIRKRYYKLSSKKIGNRELYRHQAILIMLSEEFCLTPRTIQNILCE